MAHTLSEMEAALHKEFGPGEPPHTGAVHHFLIMKYSLRGALPNAIGELIEQTWGGNKQESMGPTLSKLEEAVHKQFDQKYPPSKQEVINFIDEKYPGLDKKYPNWDGGIETVIALAGLVLQAWDIYRNEQERQIETRRASGRGPCPVCRGNEVWKHSEGKLTCRHDFIW